MIVELLVSDHGRIRAVWGLGGASPGAATTAPTPAGASPTQRAQYRLVKEYTLNYSRIPNMV